MAVLVVVYAIDSSASVNGLRLPLQDRRAIVSLCPQGWDFFTRDPQEARTDVYRLEQGQWRRLDFGASAEPRHAFGFSRSARVLGMETGALRKSVRSTPEWAECTDAPQQCLGSQETSPIELVNAVANPVLCGPLAFVQQRPVPWAWSRSRAPTVMPSKFFRANVRCSSDSKPS